MAELVRLQICVQLDDTWVWVAQDAPIDDEGGQADPAPVHAPPPPPAPTKTMPQRMARLEGFSTWVTTGLGRIMDKAGVTYVPYAQTHVSYQRGIRQRTGEASTSIAQQDPQQSDP
ncbi:hypothetical protein Tco_0712649 [Tanacetum coccineum]